MNRFETITICKSNYDTKDDFWNAVLQGVKLCLENDEEAGVFMDDGEIVSIEHGPRAYQHFGNANLHWITEDERMELEACREDGTFDNEGHYIPASYNDRFRKERGE